MNREDSVATTVAPTPRLWQQKGAQIAAALVFGATILPLGQFAFKQVQELWQGRQPQADQRLVSSLRVGVLFDDFQEKFGHRPNARLAAVEGYRRYLFVLDNAYVQAFVGDDDTVAVYGVIMKDGEKSNPIDVPGGLGDVVLGQSTVAEVMNMPEEAGGYCGAHHGQYYEATSGYGYNNMQSYAAGVTSTAITHAPADDKVISPCGSREILDAVADTDSDIGNDNLHPVPDDYFDRVRGPRSRLVIDSLFVTAPAVDLHPDMLGLHESAVGPVDDFDQWE